MAVVAAATALLAVAGFNYSQLKEVQQLHAAAVSFLTAQ